MIDDFHKQCLKQIANVIRNLGLLTSSGLPLDKDEIRVRRQPWNVAGNKIITAHRGITIHPEIETEAPGTNISDDIGYGCGVTMILAPDNSVEELGPVTDWRRIIRRKFHNKRLRGVTVERGHVCPSKVSHADFAKDFAKHDYEISSLIIRVWARESRESTES